MNDSLGGRVQVFQKPFEALRKLPVQDKATHDLPEQAKLRLVGVVDANVRSVVRGAKNECHFTVGDGQFFRGVDADDHTASIVPFFNGFFELAEWGQIAVPSGTYTARAF